MTTDLWPNIWTVELQPSSLQLLGTCSPFFAHSPSFSSTPSLLWSSPRQPPSLWASLSLNSAILFFIDQWRWLRFPQAPVFSYLSAWSFCLSCTSTESPQCNRLQPDTLSNWTIQSMAERSLLPVQPFERLEQFSQSMPESLLLSPPFSTLQH